MIPVTPERYRDITGVILAGGKSRRMGRDKALLRLGGKTFIQMITATLQRVFETVVISSNGGEKFSSLGVEVISDVYNDCGPLGGIHSALRFSRTPVIFVTGCDMPYTSEHLIRYFLEASEINRITIAECQDVLHPLFGIYPVSVLLRLEQFLESGKRKVQDFLNELTVSTVPVSSQKDPLRNINDPFAYEEALKAIGWDSRMRE